MKKGTEKLIKTTSCIAKLGIDFQESDLEGNSLKSIKKEVLDGLVKKNFNSIGCPRVSFYGWYDEETQTYRFGVDEDLFI